MLKSDAFGVDLGEVVEGLLGEPALGGAAEDFGEADGHFGGDGAFVKTESVR